MAERGGDFSQVHSRERERSYRAAQLSSALGQTVTPGEPYAEVFPTGRFRSIWAAPAKYLLASIPEPNAGAGVFETASAAETLEDDKGGLRADWSHGRQALTAYYFLDNYSLDNPYPTGTGGASVPGFDATSQGRAQLVSLEHTATFGSNAERGAAVHA